MAYNRKAAEQLFLGVINDIEKFVLEPYNLDDKLTKKNSEFYTEFFATMTDDEFHQMMIVSRDEEFILPIYVANMEEVRISAPKMREIGKKFGIKFFQRTVVTDPISNEASIMPAEVPIMYQMVRRQIQHLEKKISAAKDDKKIDAMTGQPTGESKSASMSLPEARVVDANGGQNALFEIMKVNGGDEEAYKHKREQVLATGEFSLDATLAIESTTKAVETRRLLYRGMGLDISK